MPIALSYSVKESHVAVDEGGTMVLPVHRGHGLFGAVDVSWKCEDRLSSDLMNTSGIIHFKVCVLLFYYEAVQLASFCDH